VPLVQALILGIVQGLTEFLPISSSAHLVLVPFIFGWKEPSVAFVVAVHLGTTLSILWVFRDRIIVLVRSVFGLGNPADRRFVGLIAIATLPAAIVGAIFSSQVSDAFERPVIVSFLLGGTAWILFTAESHYEARDPEKARDERMMTALDAAAIGGAQAVAILPGISRSGSTIGAGMWRGLSRETAAKFSFLMAIPVILGATVVKIPDMVHEGASGSAGAFVIGIITSALVGVWSIRAMIGFVARRGFRPFGVYCVLAMTAGVLTALARG
jgi:undecaprenyl-diphosphatase